jgi:putative endopeptidase
VTPSEPEQRAAPRFSVDHMDRTADPRVDFYRFAAGRWLRENPVPPDKVLWGAGTELRERNFQLLREILESAAADRGATPGSPRRQVGDFYASGLDQRQRDALGFAPVRPLLDRIDAVTSVAEMVHLLAALHDAGISAVFEPFVDADRRNSSVYAFYLYQGGLSLPDREYYVADGFAAQREAYRSHLTRMFRLLGESDPEAERAASTVISLESELARASRSATDLRDEVKNHHPFTNEELVARYPGIPWADYLADRRAGVAGYVVVGQPEFFAAVESLLTARPLKDWKVYLRWQVLHANAPYLQSPVEQEDFDFFHRSLLGQLEPEPPWRRIALVVDAQIGEALGQLYVERHFRSDARTRMAEMVEDLRAVFRDRLKVVEWMTEATREKALAKFDRFVAKIGHPERFRDYAALTIRPDEYAANWQRASEFEVRRRMARVGGPVDRSEWLMTPPTVNAYFNPSLNEIVFPAGILQPPFFDPTLDDAVNYGGIGGVIGHEITHGYDDQGRRYDAEGNLADWWTEADAREFNARAKVVADEYSRLEALPGLRVNGELTLGENIADFGGVTIAYDALQRRLALEPSRRKVIDGLSPEQRFFVAWAQVWRQNCREDERRRRLTVDPHSPGQFRAVEPVVNHPEFDRAFPPGNDAPASAAARPRARVW